MMTLLALPQPGAVAGLGGRCRRRAAFCSSNRSAERQAEHAGAADAEQVAAGDAVAVVRGGRTGDDEHRGTPEERQGKPVEPRRRDRRRPRFG